MDHQIFQLIDEELERQRRGVELIASENFTSPAVLKALGTCLNNKYAEGYPGKRYYGGCEVVDKIENIAIDRLKELYGAEYVNVQPHSGSQANASVYLACLKPGDAILGFDLSHGGHLTHGSPVSYSGITYQANFYGVEEGTGLIDMDKVAQKVNEVKPKMIICGASAYSRDWDYERFREIADSVGALLLADIAHPAGMIAAGMLNSPMKHCHIVTSTTHKTLRGPRGGIIMMGQDFPNPFGKNTKKGEPIMMSALLNGGVFPGMQGGPLEHVIAAKAIAFGEALTPAFRQYQMQVKKNAAAMANALIERGYGIISGGTDNHLMLIDLRKKFPDLTGRDAENALGKADITINKNMVPFDSRSPFVTSGIRIGVAAVTTRGFSESDCLRTVEWIDQVLKHPFDDIANSKVAKEINEFMTQFPLYDLSLD